MKPILLLAFKSLLNRRATAVLTVAAIAVSTALLIGVEKLRTEARTGFANTISGTDLIVGARSGAIPLLLYSVFRVGNATNNISWQSYQRFAGHPQVAWTIPLSLGDSHRGFRVLGTTAAYFDHYRYGNKRSLALLAGKPFDDVFDAVLGADVAAQLQYGIGDPLVISHGIGKIGFAKHDDKPFRVSGILERTGTPLDRTIHVSLRGIEAIHVDWRGGSRVPGMGIGAEQIRGMNLRPKAITAFLVGLKTRFATFGVQREINEFRGEPLLAILPGVALEELWSLMSGAEKALAAISVLVVATGLAGLLSMLLASLNERRRELAILRSLGARPVHIFGLISMEATLMSLTGVLVGLGLLYGAMTAAQPVIAAEYGLHLAVSAPSQRELVYAALVVAAGFLSGIIPAFRAYRRSLADGMTIRV